MQEHDRAKGDCPKPKTQQRRQQDKNTYDMLTKVIYMLT